MIPLESIGNTLVGVYCALPELENNASPLKLRFEINSRLIDLDEAEDITNQYEINNGNLL